jgi:hypothetical protein
MGFFREKIYHRGQSDGAPSGGDGDRRLVAKELGDGLMAQPAKKSLG